MTILEQLAGHKSLPEYYDTMYLDGYKPYEILEAAHRTLYKQATERREARQADIPMNVKFNVEVMTK